MNAIAKAIDAINELFGRIIAPLIAIITLIVLYDIVSRFFFGRPSDWAFDITKMLFGAHFMLMAAYGLRHHAHSRHHALMFAAPETPVAPSSASSGST